MSSARKIPLPTVLIDSYQMGCLAIGNNRIFTDCQGTIVELNMLGHVVNRSKQFLPSEHRLSSLSWHPNTTKVGQKPGKDTLLRYTAFQFYDTEPWSKPTLGTYNLTKERSTKLRKFNQEADSLWQRGGTVELGSGNGLAIGYGGYYSIMAGGSWGPALCTEKAILLGYPEGHRCIRPQNFTGPGTGDWVAPYPDRWTAADIIGGDTQTGGCIKYNNRLLFFVKLGIGKINYEDGGVKTSHGHRNYVYEYSFREVMEAENSWDPKPRIFEIEQDVRGVCLYQKQFWAYAYPNIITLDI